MFWRKVLHILGISILLIGGFAAPSAAGESKHLAKTAFAKPMATVITYVDVDAPGPTYDGTSWENAFPNLQDALTIVISGSQIWVAEGVYYPDEGAGQTNDVITSTFTLPDGVALYGGFMGIEGSLEERNWETHITVLSGDIDHETYPDTTDIHGMVTDTTLIAGSNAYHVVSSKNVTVTAIIDGFSITAGQAIYPHQYGGGMYNFHGSPTLTHLNFSGNSAQEGGGMYNISNSNPILTNVIFSDNSVLERGGGMYNEDNSNPLLLDVTFSGNSANHCGGMVNINNSSPTLVDVAFSGNSANDGGGLCNSGSNPMLTNVNFSGNSANSDGGGMYNWESSPILSNVAFSGNSSDNGGGMYNDGSSPSLTNVTFSRNSAGIDGGSIYNTSESNPSLTNVILWGNTAVISGNQIINSSSTPVINYTLIQDSGGSGAGWDSSLGTDGGGNIDEDPLFVDPLNDHLHLMHGSPAVDAGDDSVCPTTDLNGIPRPQGAGCDMGAFEFVPVAISMSVDNPAPVPGETFTFTINVTNYLTETMTDGLISDTLPAGLNFFETIILDPPTAGTVGSELPILVTDLEIGVGEQVTVTLPVGVSDGLAAGTIITNIATVTSDQVTFPVLVSATITVAEPDTYWIYLPLVTGK